jgi:hypothetical protein
VAFPFEPDDFNAPEQFIAELHAVCTNDNGWVWKARADVVWIEVDYTEPPVSGAGVSSAGSLVLLSAMGSWVRRERRKKILAVSLG